MKPDEINDAWEVRQGDVLVVVLDGTQGYEKTGTRPVVVVQNNGLNGAIDTAVVAPCTTRRGQTERRPGRPHEVYLAPASGGLEDGTVVDCSQARTVDIDERLVATKGWLEDGHLERVLDAMVAVVRGE